MDIRKKENWTWGKIIFLRKKYIGKNANFEEWKLGKIVIWKNRNLEKWKPEKMEIRKNGNLEKGE